MKTKIIIILIIFFGYSSLSLAINKKIYKEGRLLVQQMCISCHQPRGSGNRAAPPFFKVLEHYDGKSKKKIKGWISEFLKKPSEEISRMPGAVRRFGLMPNLGLGAEQINKASYYLSRTDLEDLNTVEEPSGKVEENLASRGMKIALSTKSLLGKNLLLNLKKKGSLGAVKFCSLKAPEFTKIKEKEFGVSIKRATDKARNLKNKANDEELKYIAHYKKELDKKSGDLKPVIVKSKLFSNYYSPIITNNMCLQCHGDPSKDINKKTHRKIVAKYPKDEAVGYKADQLRGIWSIQFKN